MTPVEWEQFVQSAGSSSTYLDWVTSVQESEGIAQWITAETGEKYILTKSGSLLNETQVYGEWLSTREMTGQLITNAEVNAGTGAVEVYTGDVIDTATGEVLSRGATTGAVSLGTVASAGCAVLGGVVAGINLYESNPDFWTALSQTLLPFCYEDPTEGGWENVWDALFPVAVDSAGNTLVPYNAMQAMYSFFAQNNPWGINELRYVDLTQYQNTSFTVTPSMQPYAYIAAVLSKFNIPIDWLDAVTPSFWQAKWVSIYFNKVLLSRYLTGQGSASGELFTIYFSTNPNDKTSTLSLESDWTGVYGSGKSWTCGVDRTNSGYLKASTTTININNGSIVSRSTSNNSSYTTQAFSYRLGVQDTQPTVSNSGEIRFGVNAAVSLISSDAVMDKQTGAVVPVENGDIITSYPNWQPITYYNIEEDEDTGEQTIVAFPWLPLTLPTGNPTADDFFTDKDQGESQTGDATEPQQQEKIDYLPPGSTTTPQDPTGNNGDETPIAGVPLNGALAGIFHVYNPTLAELQALNSYMWTENIAKLIAEIFNNNPVDAVIGLQSLYATPSIGGRANIKLGYMDSGVASDYVDEQFITIDCGDRVIPEYFQTAYDYEPYTKVYVFLPFIGIRQLSPYDIVGGKVNITYTIDVLTGICCAKISVNKGENTALLYSFDGCCACELPVTAGSRASQIKNTVGGIVGGALSGAAMGGVPGAIVGGVVGGLGGAARGAEISMSGNLGGVAGACAPRIPFIIVKRTKPYNAVNYNQFYGSPANATIRLGDVSGFTRVKKVHVENISNATNEEKIMIRDMLMAGVIV